jgi:DNA polymerase-3 subunit epsilon/ATP-dependent DNA helicase DinG
MSAGGPCFLRAAREKAGASHLVVVNHALLLSDIATGGALLPEYDTLIVDEAHHLEEEATRQLGFELAQLRFDDHVQTLSGDRGGLLNEAINAFRGSSATASRRSAVEKQSAETTLLLPRMRERVASLFAMLAGAIGNGAANGSGSGQDLRITKGTRAQPAWSQVEVEWESVDILLAELGKSLGKLYTALEGLEDANLVNYEGLMMELTNAQQTNADLREKLAEFISKPKPDGIYWVTRGGGTTPLSPPLTRGETGGSYPRLTLHAAPLHVGETLEQLLFSEKRCVVMTSATLSASGTFDHVCERTGFAGAEELLLGSPFDYPRAALLCVPEDMPEPNSWAYQTALEEAITDAALAAGGRTMALFTSHSALQATASAIRGRLLARGIPVLAQGINGTPPQLVRRFLENPKAVLLGTASFWEGVDLSGESLKVLVVTRLPFSVPTEPVFAARSELYEDSFGQYAVPQAILRLRQGFGRLIRTKTDRGVAIILDRRIVSKRYGKSFLDSLPRSSFKACQLYELPGEIKKWVQGSGFRGRGSGG